MNQNPNRYFIINKPYKMVSQFVSPDKVNLLGDIDFDWPEGTHAIGRLDNNSEGLLILTTNKRVTKLLFESDTPHKRTYLVHVEKVVTPERLLQLQTGITNCANQLDTILGGNEAYKTFQDIVAFATSLSETDDVNLINAVANLNTQKKALNFPSLQH
jgi:pseudouridine synthase